MMPSLSPPPGDGLTFDVREVPHLYRQGSELVTEDEFRSNVEAADGVPDGMARERTNGYSTSVPQVVLL